MDVDREQVLAYRVGAHGLDRRSGSLADLRVLDLGVQDSPAGSAALALAARLDSVPAPDERSYAMAWSHRGAPHLHRAADLRRLATALWPWSDADARSRVTGLGPALKKTGFSGVEAYARTAGAVYEVSSKPIAKGDLSAAVTELIPEPLKAWCRGCACVHVFDQLLRVAALPGGVRIVPGSAPLTFTRIARWPGVPKKTVGAESIVRAYLTLHGPAGPSEVASFMNSSTAEMRTIWPDDMAEVRLNGKKRFIPEDALASLRKAKAPEGVRLLPPSDPFLQARDRDLLVPEKAHRKELWTILAGPGALLVDGDVAGTWRVRATGRNKLEVTVAPFAKVSPSAVKAVEAEAARVATARGAADVEVAYA